MSILMHSCCGPCLGGSFPEMEQQFNKNDIAVFWDNPNIHPYIEYKLRLESFQKMSKIIGLDIFYGDWNYGLDKFMVALKGEYGRERCKACYELRLDAVASKAKEEGFDAFTSTLLISPYQDQELIKSVAVKASQKYGVPFHFIDLRPGFKQTHEAIRENELYKQKYCGCIFSEYDRYKGAKKYKLPNCVSKTKSSE